MITFKEHELHYLMDKYAAETEIGKVIRIMIAADDELMEGCPDALDEEGMPNMEALNAWSNRRRDIYIMAIGRLKELHKEQPKNADILALMGNGYYEIDDYRMAVKCLQQALELDLNEIRFMDFLLGVCNRWAYEMFRKTPEYEKIDQWHGKYMKMKHFLS